MVHKRDKKNITKIGKKDYVEFMVSQSMSEDDDKKILKTIMKYGGILQGESARVLTALSGEYFFKALVPIENANALTLELKRKGLF